MSGMTWVAFRQHRSELLVALGVFALMAAYLIPTGLNHVDVFRSSGLEACLDAGGDCSGLRDQLMRSYEGPNNIVGWFNFVPGFVGVMLAAPIIWDLEQRTYRLAWTQSVTRKQWLLTKLAMGLAGVVAFSALLTSLMTWWHGPIDRSLMLPANDLGQSYDFEGLMPFSYTLFAFALALAVGTASRRLLAGILVGLAGFIAMRGFAGQVLRQDVTGASPADALGEATRDMHRFWETQAVEALVFLSIAAVLLGLTYWLVTRRVNQGGLI
jgi:hypothetical protein